MINRLRIIGSNLKHELKIYQLVLNDRRTPRLAKVFLGAAVGYALLPFDLIPDFIPVIGHLDDVVIVPVLVMIGLRLVPQDVVDACRTQVEASEYYDSLR